MPSVMRVLSPAFRTHRRGRCCRRMARKSHRNPWRTARRRWRIATSITEGSSVRTRLRCIRAAGTRPGCSGTTTGSIPRPKSARGPTTRAATWSETFLLLVLIATVRRAWLVLPPAASPSATRPSPAQPLDTTKDAVGRDRKNALHSHACLKACSFLFFVADCPP